MIELFYSPTPNGRKISIMLEECKIDYKITLINLSKDEQFKPEFLKLNPYGKIPVIIEPSGHQAILSGRGDVKPTLEYLPDNHSVQNGNKIYTSGKEGIFAPGIPIGEAKIVKNRVEVLLFSDLKQITFINIDLGALD